MLLVTRLLEAVLFFDLHDCTDMHSYIWPADIWVLWLKGAEKTKIWILAATMWVLVPQGPFPRLEGWVRLAGRERVSGVTCGGVWGFVALVWRKIELQADHTPKESYCSDCKCNYKSRWIYLTLLMREAKSTVIHKAWLFWQGCLWIYFST